MFKLSGASRQAFQSGCHKGVDALPLARGGGSDAPMQVVEKMLILARTTPRDAVAKPSLGMTYSMLTSTAAGSRCARSPRWPNGGRFEPVVHRRARGAGGRPDRQEGRGFQCILHGMNPERILIAAEAVGLGRAALARVARYAKERVVFGRPIGQNQGIQHPVAERWIELEAAELMVRRAAAACDAGEEAGAFANAAKYCAAEAGFRACETPMLTHGGMGYAREYHVERYFRAIQIACIVPVSAQLILSHIAERLLGLLPKSY
jgi:acyl-CoA dehydrogenase